MKLSHAARFFDRSVLADAYTPSTTFIGQLSPFDDVLRDSVTTDRRMLSVAPEVTIPARRAVTLEGETWLVGEEQLDHFNGSVIRKKYVLQRAKQLATLKTLTQALDGSAGVQAYAARVYVKPIREPDESSLQLGLYDIYLSSAETVADATLISIDGRWHLTRLSHPTTGGFVDAVADELLQPLQVSAVLSNQTYNKTTDSRSTVTVTASALLLRWQSYFALPLSASAKFERGDDIVIVRQAAATPKAGDFFTIGNLKYTVISVLDQSTVWSCHVRRT